MNNYNLIQNIKIRRALWDKSLWDRIDGSAREVMWDDVADQMKTPKDIVKTRWKNLRDSYRKLLLRHLNNSLPDSRPRWRYYRHLEFIKEIVLSNKPKVGDISLKNAELVSIEPDYSLTLEATDDNETNVDPLSFASAVNVHEMKVEREVKGKLADDLPSFSDIELEKSDSQDRYAAAAYSNDDDLQFLLSLHQHFKQVPMHRKLPLRMSIEKIIHDELYQCRDNQNSNF